MSDRACLSIPSPRLRALSGGGASALDGLGAHRPNAAVGIPSNHPIGPQRTGYQCIGAPCMGPQPIRQQLIGPHPIRPSLAMAPP